MKRIYVVAICLLISVAAYASIILQTLSGTGKNIYNADGVTMALVDTYQPSAEQYCAAQVNLTNLNGAAAVISVRLEHTTSGDVLRASSRDMIAYAKYSATSTAFGGRELGPVLLAANEKMKIYALSTNSSDTNASYSIDIINLKGGDILRITGTDLPAESVAGNFANSLGAFLDVAVANRHLTTASINQGADNNTILSNGTYGPSALHTQIGTPQQNGVAVTLPTAATVNFTGSTFPTVSLPASATMNLIGSVTSITSPPSTSADAQTGAAAALNANTHVLSLPTSGTVPTTSTVMSATIPTSTTIAHVTDGMLAASYSAPLSATATQSAIEASNGKLDVVYQWATNGTPVWATSAQVANEPSANWSWSTRSITSGSNVTISGTKTKLDDLHDATQLVQRSEPPAISGFLGTDGHVLISGTKQTLDALHDATQLVQRGEPLTSQQTRDAMKLAPSAGDAAVGSIDYVLAHLSLDPATIVSALTDSTPYLAAVGTAGNAAVTAAHGSGPYTPVGTGSVVYTFQPFTDSSTHNPIQGAVIIISTDAARHSQLFAPITDNFGKIPPQNLDPGTYYWTMVKPGYPQTPTKFIVAG